MSYAPSTANDVVTPDAYEIEDNELGVDEEWLRTSPKPKPKLFAYDWASGYVSPFRSTPLDSFRELCEAIIALQLLKSEWKDQVFYDLGCGDGIVNVEIAKLYGTRSIGLDLDEALIAKAQAFSATHCVDHLTSFRVQDLLTVDLSDATVIFLYLLPEALEKLKPILEPLLLNAGVILIVEQWPLVNWEHHIVYTHKQGAFRVYAHRVS